MSDLTGKKIKDTYRDILKVTPSSDNSGIDSTARQVTDGDGTGTPLALSNTAVVINNVDINNGAIDNTEIGEGGAAGDAAAGSFSRLGAGGASSANTTTKLHRENKTQLEFGDLVFQKTGVIAGNLSTKTFYQFLKVNTYDATSAGHFVIDIEAIATTGTSTGGSSEGDLDVSSFTPDGKSVQYMKSKAMAMHRTVSDAGHVKTKNIQITGEGHAWDSKKQPYGTWGHHYPEQNLHGFAFTIDAGADKVYKYGESGIDASYTVTQPHAYMGTDAININSNGNPGIKVPKAGDMYNWSTHNAHTGETSFTNLDSIELPIWGDSSSAHNGGAGTGIPATPPYDGSNHEVMTYELGYDIGEFDSNDYFWPIQIGTTAGYFNPSGTATDNDHLAAICITYNIKVISTYNGVNNRGYVKSIQEGWF